VLKPGSATRPFFGVAPEIVSMDGKPVPLGSGGYLVIRQPWPAMLRTIYGDPERYVQNYWSQIPGTYFTGDGARKDKDGYYWIMGRVDDVLNVSGHRLSTMEVESALVAHDKVAEAVVGRPDDIKGQSDFGFVSLEHGVTPSPELKEELKRWVAKEIGALAKPDDIRFTDMLPKTRSGRDHATVACGVPASSGDVKWRYDDREDFGVIARLKEQDEV
jgi:acetyl-CoA synthetase